MPPRLFILCALFLLLITLPASAQEKSTGKPAPKAAPVVAGETVRRSVPVLLAAIGTVEASEVVEIKARISGLLQKVHFVEGQDVHRGDLLFSIDSRDLEAKLRSARADLDRSRAKLAKAEEDKRRFDRLLDKGIISRDQQETTATALSALQAEIRAGEASVEAAKVELSHAEIRSPINGRAGALQLHAGNMVKANADTAMVVLYCVEPVNVRFSLPEMHLATIMKGQNAGPLKVQTKPAGADETVPGVLYFIDSSVDAGTGTIALKARFANAKRLLWPGQFADVTLEVGALQDAVLVPAQAVTPGAEGEFVYIIRPDNTVEYRVVKTGQRHDGHVVVTSGLDGGERVVLEGHLRLAPGAAVTIRSGDGQATPGTPADSKGQAAMPGPKQ